MQEILLHRSTPTSKYLFDIAETCFCIRFQFFYGIIFEAYCCKSDNMEKYGLLLICVLVFTGCDKQKEQNGGFLEGIISIGPICPVETVPPEPGCRPTAATYKAYPVGVWTTDLKTRIAIINPSLDGSFSMEMVPGNYLVVLETGENSIAKSNLPLGVTILPANKTTIKINIDTGIR